MLISMNPMRIYELCALCAKSEQKYILCVDNTNYHYFLNTEDKKKVKEYYFDIISETEYEEIFNNNYTFYKLSTKEYATGKCVEWFPPKGFVEEKCWIHVYVIAPDGTIPHDNSFENKNNES